MYTNIHKTRILVGALLKEMCRNVIFIFAITLNRFNALFCKHCSKLRMTHNRAFWRHKGARRREFRYTCIYKLWNLSRSRGRAYLFHIFNDNEGFQWNSRKYYIVYLWNTAVYFYFWELKSMRGIWALNSPLTIYGW